jgi:stearoyl-CoA desaturase (delta-9 desaturase)
VADHRYFSHRAFKTSRCGEWFLALCSGLVFQDSLFNWATDHRSHHRYSDDDGENRHRDPHNAMKGFFYSFSGWLLVRNPHRDDLEDKQKRGKGLYEDRVLNLLQFLPFLWACLGGIAAGLYWFGGWSAVAYGTLGLIVLPSLDMFLVNSVGHGHGPKFLHRRTYETGEHSTNVALLALIGSGVGWHNNHHAFPWSARAGLEWWQVDKAWWMIRTAERLRLVWDVKCPTPEQKAKRKRAT